MLAYFSFFNFPFLQKLSCPSFSFFQRAPSREKSLLSTVLYLLFLNYQRALLTGKEKLFHLFNSSLSLSYFLKLSFCYFPSSVMHTCGPTPRKKEAGRREGGERVCPEQQHGEIWEGSVPPPQTLKVFKGKNKKGASHACVFKDFTGERGCVTGPLFFFFCLFLEYCYIPRYTYCLH